MPRTRRSSTPAFKLRVVREVEAGTSLAQAAREHHIHPNLSRTWRKRYGEHGADAFAPAPPSSDTKVAELEQLVGQRDASGVVHHSDHGRQYTSLAFGARCREAGVRPPLGSVGDCYDNATCESFFATLECELLDRRRFATKSEARMAVFHFIEGWYNVRRRHSALGYESPLTHERNHHAAALATSL